MQRNLVTPSWGRRWGGTSALLMLIKIDFYPDSDCWHTPPRDNVSFHSWTAHQRYRTNPSGLPNQWAGGLSKKSIIVSACACQSECACQRAALFTDPLFLSFFFFASPSKYSNAVPTKVALEQQNDEFRRVSMIHSHENLGISPYSWFLLMPRITRSMDEVIEPVQACWWNLCWVYKPKSKTNGNFSPYSRPFINHLHNQCWYLIWIHYWFTISYNTIMLLVCHRPSRYTCTARII